MHFLNLHRTVREKPSYRPTHHKVIKSATHRYSKNEGDQQESTGHSGGLRKKKTHPVDKEESSSPWRMAGLRYCTYHPMSARLDAGLLARATGLSALFFRSTSFAPRFCLFFVILLRVDVTANRRRNERRVQSNGK